MKLILIASIFGFFLFPSCQNQHTHSSGSDVVALNHGQRWEANPETTTGIANMQMILENAKGKELDMVDFLKDQMIFSKPDFTASTSAAPAPWLHLILQCLAHAPSHKKSSRQSRWGQTPEPAVQKNVRSSSRRPNNHLIFYTRPP